MAQLVEGTPYHSPKLHLGVCYSVRMQHGTDTQTDKHTEGRDQYTFRLATPNVKHNYLKNEKQKECDTRNPDQVLIHDGGLESNQHCINKN